MWVAYIVLYMNFQRYKLRLGAKEIIMSDRPSNAFFGVLRLMFLYVFFFFGCSKNYDPTYKDDFYAVLPGYNHEDKSARNTNLPFPRQPAERWSSRRTDNVPLSRKNYEPSWREYPSNRTYEPYHEENLSRVNLGQQYTSREEMACSTRINRTKPTKAKPPDLEKGCDMLRGRCFQEFRSQAM